MNTVHIHLLLNHFPVIGTLMGGGLLLWGILKKQDAYANAAAVILFLVALIAIPVYLTGEPAEEAVEHLPGVQERAIEMHESAAGLAMILMAATGLTAVLTLILSRRQKQSAGIARVVLFAITFLCFSAMARTGYYGGQIRHTETGATVQDVQTDKKKITRKAMKTASLHPPKKKRMMIETGVS